MMDASVNNITKKFEFDTDPMQQTAARRVAPIDAIACATERLNLVMKKDK